MRPQSPAHNRSRESGVALVAVLWTVILLAVLATGVIAAFRSNARILSAQAEHEQAMEAAKAGINLAIVALASPGGLSTIDGTRQTFQLGDATIEVAISAESGKIDLNTANPDLLRSLLASSGMGSGTADRLAEEINQRRFIRAPGPLETLGEMSSFPEITADAYARLVPNMTVFSSSSTVDIKLAPPDVIRALPGNTEADVEATERARSTDAEASGSLKDLSQIVGHSFSITAVAKLPDHTTARRTEIVRLTGNPKEPFWILASD